MKVRNILFIPILLLFFIVYASSSQDVSFGFYPTKTNPASYQPNWTSLTHVSYLAWIANADGTISDRNQNTSSYANTIFQDAHQHGVKTVIGIGTGNQSVMDNILANHASDFANNISSKIKSTGSEGVILDFEYPQNINSITGTSNTVLYENMMKTIYNKVKAMDSSYTVGICTPPILYDYMQYFKNSNLRNYVDIVFIMGYDYNYAGPAAANSPFYNDSTRYGLRYAVNEQSQYYGKDKLVYGIPFYGYEYIATSNQPGTSVLSVEGEFFIKDINSVIQKYGRQWDPDSNTPYCYYLNDSSEADTKIILDNCDSLGSIANDYQVNRTVEKGVYKCVATSSGNVYMLLQNDNRWNLSSATYVCADVKAPVGKSMVLRLFSSEYDNYVNYRFSANGNWQHIIIPFKKLYQYGVFNPGSVYEIRIGMFGSAVGDTYYVDNITSDTYVNTYHQVWYEDTESLTLKHQYIKDQGLLGVGFWALGYEGNNSSIWNVFARQSLKLKITRFWN